MARGMQARVQRRTRRGGFEAIKKRQRTPGTVDVGVIDAGSHVDSDLTVASIAYLNEFGIGVPERPFFRWVTKAKKKEILVLTERLHHRVKMGELTLKQALGLLGEFVSDLIKQRIVELRQPPNAPETIRRKGSSNPLIDTGQMRNSITYQVNL